MASKNASAAHQKHLAVLIDADNAPAAIVQGLFEERAQYGVVKVEVSMVAGRSSSTIR